MHNQLQYALFLLMKLPYSLNILRQKIFADFEIFDLPQKIILEIFRLILITCGAYVWLVFALMSCYSIINL